MLFLKVPNFVLKVSYNSFPHNIHCTTPHQRVWIQFVCRFSLLKLLLTASLPY